MNDKDRRVLEKISQHIEAILRYCRDCNSLEDFQDDTMLVEATVFNLMQIGELATEELSDPAKAAIGTIPWHQLYGMRNRIVHGYAGINLRIVWDTVREDIPRLRDELAEYMKDQ